MNPFDEIAVEEAIRLKEKGQATEIVAVSIGPQQAAETIRTALAMGADRGILVKTDRHRRAAGGRQDPQGHRRCRRSPASSSWASRRSTTTATRPARCWPRCTGWPQGTFASKLAIEGDSVQVTREVDGGLQTVKLKAPAIVTTDLRLNEPRYASLPNIMKAKKKPIDEKTPGRLRRRRRAAARSAQDHRAAGRKAGVKVEDRRPSWSTSSRTRRG